MNEINKINVDGQDYDLAIKLGNGLTYNDNHELEFYTDNSLGIKDGLLGVKVRTCGGIISTSHGLEVNTGKGITINEGKISLKIGSGIELRSNNTINMLLAPNSGLKIDNKGLFINFGRGMTYDQYGGLTLQLGSGLTFEDRSICLDEDYLSKLGLGSGNNLSFNSCSATPLNIYSDAIGSSVFKTNTTIQVNCYDSAMGQLHVRFGCHDVIIKCED